MNDSKVNKLILKSAYITIIILIIVVIALLILKYDVEGERNIPFKLSSIIVVSSAEGYQEKENLDYKWDVEVFQNNDIYLNIEKNKNHKETEIIKSNQLENIQIDNKPTVGEYKVYRMYSDNSSIFTYKEEYEIKDKIEYLGDLSTDLNNLKISNQGGTIVISAVNKTKLPSKLLVNSALIRSIKSMAGKVILKLNLFIMRTNSSVNIPIFLKKKPAAIIKNTGMVAFRLYIKFSIVSSKSVLYPYFITFWWVCQHING